MSNSKDEIQNTKMCHVLCIEQNNLLNHISNTDLSRVKCKMLCTC